MGEPVGRSHTVTLRDGRAVDLWEGGDPSGQPVLVHPGTPCARLMAAHLDADARSVGARLVSLSRPGYGGTTLTPPGLASVARDTVEVADLLGIGELAVLGISGGGPYAVAVGIVAPPGRVATVGIAAGVGRWPVIDPPTEEDAGDRRWLAMAESGAVDEATDGLRRDAEEGLGALLAMDDEAMVDAFFSASPPGNQSRHDDEPEFRAGWARDLRESLRTFDGYVRDNLSWGLPWDVDLGSSRVPHRLWYGSADTMAGVENGRWLAERLPEASMTVLEGEGHGAVSFDHALEILGELTAR